MTKSGTEKCIDLLAAATEPVADGQLADASGLTIGFVRRLRTSPEFITEVNRRAKQDFLARMPTVLAALADAAADGKNASAMKLFIDACRAFELAFAEAGGADPDAADLLQRMRDAGVDPTDTDG